MYNKKSINIKKYLSRFSALLSHKVRNRATHHLLNAFEHVIGWERKHAVDRGVDFKKKKNFEILIGREEPRHPRRSDFRHVPWDYGFRA